LNAAAGETAELFDLVIIAKRNMLLASSCVVLTVYR
jgi:hypothetical protein